jgi:dienelactone hydrolase
MRLFLPFALLFLLLSHHGFGQAASTRLTPEQFGYRHLVVMFGRDSVHVLVQSKKGEEKVKKPLLLWVQGSLPRPLILVDSLGPLRVFPFATRSGADSLAARCHLVIIGKPGIPLVGNLKDLDDNASFVDKASRIPPAAYCERNYLEYYVRRNTAVLRYLKRQAWVDGDNVTVGGHSEGSSIAAGLAAVPGLVHRAVYLSGNPLGRMMSIIADNRQRPESANDTAAVAGSFRWWHQVMANPTQGGCTPGDNNRTTASFSGAPMRDLLRARVPVFIGYGSLDKAVLSNDYLRLESMRLHKTTITFRDYPGREHNFFSLKNGQPDYDEDYWPVVGRDFLRWAGLWPQ